MAKDTTIQLPPQSGNGPTIDAELYTNAFSQSTIRERKSIIHGIPTIGQTLFQNVASTLTVGNNTAVPSNQSPLVKVYRLIFSVQFPTTIKFVAGSQVPIGPINLFSNGMVILEKSDLLYLSYGVQQSLIVISTNVTPFTCSSWSLIA